MANQNISKLERKKQELESEITRLQSGLDDSIESVKEGVVQNLDPKSTIRKFPLPALGISLVVGYMLGHSRKRGYESQNSVGNLLGSELKRMITKKGISLITDYVESKISSDKNPQD